MPKKKQDSKTKQKRQETNDIERQKEKQTQVRKAGGTEEWGERTKRRHLGLNHFAIRPERRLQATIIRGPCQASDKTSVLCKLGHD
jgi:hypothetical protein